MSSKAVGLKEITGLLQQFRPYVPEGTRNVWHDQVKGFIFMLGVFVGASPIPEYPVPSPFRRGRTGRIDVVWLAESHSLAAFEIDSGIKPGSVRKLEAFPARWKFILSAGPKAGVLKLLGSERLAGTDIAHLVIEPTEDAEVSWHSAMEAVRFLLTNGMELTLVPEPKSTLLQVD